MSKTAETTHEESEKVVAFSEVNSYIAALGDPRGYKVKLYRSKPGALADGTKCGGHLTDIDNPEELEEKNVRELFGGGNFFVLIYENGKAGIKKKLHFELGGAAKMPVWMLGDPARAPEGGNGKNGNGSSLDQTLGSRALDAAVKDAERANREREDREKELRRHIEEKAVALAERDAMRHRIAELEARPGQLLAEKAAERDMTKIALETIQSHSKDREEAYRRELESMRSAKQDELAPFRQFLHDVSLQQEKSLVTVGQQFQMMLSQQQQQNQMMMDMLQRNADNQRSLMEGQIRALRDELTSLRTSKEGGILGDLDKFTGAVEKIMKISGKLGSNDEPKDVATQVMEVIGSAIENAPEFMKALRGQAGPAGMVGAGQAQAQMTPAQAQVAAENQRKQAEQERETALLLDTIADAYKRGLDPTELAVTVSKRVGSGGVADLLKMPAEQLIAAIMQNKAELSSTEGENYLKRLRAALSML